MTIVATAHSKPEDTSALEAHFPPMLPFRAGSITELFPRASQSGLTWEKELGHCCTVENHCRIGHFTVHMPES
jgi:hypothetical protein